MFFAVLLYLILEMACSIAVLFTAWELAVCIAWDWGVDVDVCLWCMCGVCVCVCVCVCVRCTVWCCMEGLVRKVDEDGLWNYWLGNLYQMNWIRREYYQ